MKNIYVIDGLGGTGKSDMIDYISFTYSKTGEVSILKKYTSRDKRPEEKIKAQTTDLEFVSKRKFADLKAKKSFLHYEFDGKEYGFEKNTLDELLIQSDHVFVIVRNLGLIGRIRELYSDCNIILIFVYSDKEKVLERLKADGYDDEAIEFRLGRIDMHWANYMKNSSIYNDVIINNGTKGDFQRQIDDILNYYRNDPKDELHISFQNRYFLVKSLIGHKEAILKQLKKYPFEKNVFLMMKFRDSNKLIYQYIKEYIEDQGYNCVRADEKGWNLTADVYNPIAVLYCCKYGIALFDEPEDMSHFSPNVAYELGIMHYQKKNCLILKHSTLKSMPFDLIKDLHKVYDKPEDTEKFIRKWAEEIKED